jgi:chromosome segregation ATPase
MPQYPPTFEQLTTLREALAQKKAQLDDQIDNDEAAKEELIKEMRAVSTKMQEQDTRMSKMKAARKEYAKTIQETEFALEKINETARQMHERFAKMGATVPDF